MLIEANCSFNYIYVISLPQILCILHEGSVIPHRETKAKKLGRDGGRGSRVFHNRYSVEWLSLQFQKTQPSNYGEIYKSRKVKRMAENMLIGPRSMLQPQGRTAGANITSLVPGRFESFSYIDPPEYDPRSAVFNKYKSPAVLKAIQNAKTATKISFYRFVQFIKNLSEDREYQKHIATMCLRREAEKKRSVKKGKTESQQEAEEESEWDKDVVHPEGNVELGDVSKADRRPSTGDSSLGSAAFEIDDPSAAMDDPEYDAPPLHKRESPTTAESDRDFMEHLQSHSFTNSDVDDDVNTIESGSVFGSEHQQSSRQPATYHGDPITDTADTSQKTLEYIMLKLRVLISKVNIEHLHYRSTRLTTRNVAAKESVFKESTTREATLRLEGTGLSLKDISNGILIMRGGALDDPEVC